MVEQKISFGLRVMDLAAPAAKRHDALPDQRLDWPDAVRGIAIVLVVYAHAARGVDRAGHIDHTTLFETVDRAIYLFHMPLFFIVSGFLFSPLSGVDMASISRRVARLVTHLVYPLLLWTYIYLIIKLMLGTMLNGPVTLADIGLPLPPVDHFWFLWALFLIQLGALAMTTAFRGWAGLMAVVGVCALASTAGPGDPYLVNAIRNAPYFVVGMLLARLPIMPHAGALIVSGAAAFVGAQGLTLLTGALWEHRQLLAMGAALGFIGIVIGYVTLRPGDAIVRLSALLGRESMAIYLAHVFFSAAVRIGLLKIGVADTGVHLLLGTVAGIIGPLALSGIARHFGVSRLLGF